MSNVLPTQEQKSVWTIHRTRFIFLGSIVFSILACIQLLTLSPSYVLLMLNRPEASALTAKGSKAIERIDAAKTAALIATLLPVTNATTSPMEAIAKGLEGKPDDIIVNQITYSGDPNHPTIKLVGTVPSRESINAFKRQLEAKGIYKSVYVPVEDLIGTSGNQFNVTLVSN